MGSQVCPYFFGSAGASLLCVGVSQTAYRGVRDPQSWVTAHRRPRMVGQSGSKNKVWSPVTVETRLVVTGGLSPEAHCVETKSVLTDTGDAQFVKLDKNAKWVLKVVGGASAVKGELRESTVIEDLRKKVDTATLECDNVETPSKAARVPAAAGTREPSSHIKEKAKPDRMAKIACLSEHEEGRVKRAKRNPRPCDQVVCVEMPKCPSDPTGEKVQVRVLPLRFNSQWIHTADIPWLMNYMRWEVLGGNIPDPAATEAAPPAVADGAPDGSTVAEPFRTRWGFRGEWECRIQTGTLAGHVIKSRVSEMTPEKWARVQALGLCAGPWETASDAEKKEACRLFLEDHAKATVEKAETTKVHG